MKKLFFAIVFILLNSAILYSQEKTGYYISGKVINESEEPVPYCTIAIWQQSDSSLVTGGITDEKGLFKIGLLKKGRYEVRVSHLQYGNLSLPLDLNQDVRMSSIKLHSSAVQLDEVTVIAVKPLVKFSSDKIVYDVTNDPEAKRGSLQKIFEKLPLVTPSKENFLIRGNIAPTYLINGKKSSSLAVNPINVLKSIPANTIKEIQIITNPGAKYDGDNTGGIINIITKNKVSTPLSAYIGTSIDTKGSVNETVSIGTQIKRVFIQGTYSHSDTNNYKEKTISERTNDDDLTNYLLKQKKNTKYTKDDMNMVMLESSWVPDTMSIVNFSLNYYHLDTRGKETQWNTMLDNQGNETYSYLNNGKNKTLYENLDLSANYQRKINKNGNLLLMYKYTDLPKEADNYFMIEDAIDYNNPSMHNWQKEKSKEHTMQLDYTYKSLNKHFLNAGVKYIIRNNTNDSKYYTLDENEQWNYQYSPDDYFRHRQRVLAIYGEYELKLKPWSYKVGLRDELTKEKVMYADDKSQNFNVNFNDLLPFGSISYNLKNGDLLSATYSSRILRPSIYYLNPKITYIDPSSIYYGNPDIQSEKHRTTSLEYSANRQKYSFNLSLDYTFCNNSIESFYGINDEGLSFQTYNNHGSSKNASLSGYISCKPVQFLRFSVNATGRYVYLKDSQNGESLTNNGWTGNLSSNVAINLPKDFYLTLNGSYSFPRIDLQGKYFNFYFCSWELSKSILKNKLDLSIRGSDVFWNNKKYHSTYTNQIKMKTEHWNPGMIYELSANYRFDSSNLSMKRTSKTIHNNDVKTK